MERQKGESESNFSGCRLGEGKRVETLFPPVDVYKAIREKFDLSEFDRNPNKVLLTPVNTTLEIFPGENTWSRGVEQHRSFSRKIAQKDGGKCTLIVKSGDFHNYEGVRRNLIRVRNGQIPGGGLLEEHFREARIAYRLQKTALEKLGRLTHLPMPVEVSEIFKVPNIRGGLVSVRDFMNSGEYPQITNHEIKELWNVPKDKDLGDYLIGEKKLKPAEYIYIIEGGNVRSHEIYSLLLFNQANDEMWKDPLARLEAGIFKYGVYLEEEGRSLEDSIRAVYKYVSRAYGVSDGFVGSDHITSKNYLDRLHKIRHDCYSVGPGPEILAKFIDRVTEVSALVHSDGFVFSPQNKDIGGSLITRNVTSDGVILDLDTVTSIELSQAEYITKDFEELLLSLACMRRLVSLYPVKNLFEEIRLEYISKVARFCESRLLRERIVAATAKEKIDPFYLKCL